jgi:hypothetical protein
VDTDSRCKTPVGGTVIVADASYTSTIDDPILISLW